MKWVAAVIVSFGFLYGLIRGWRVASDIDVITYPLSGFVFGLLLFGLARLWLRSIHRISDDSGVGTVIYWISVGVALYYAGLAAMKYVLGYFDRSDVPLVITGFVCWATGWALQNSRPFPGFEEAPLAQGLCL